RAPSRPRPALAPGVPPGGTDGARRRRSTPRRDAAGEHPHEPGSPSPGSAVGPDQDTPDSIGPAPHSRVRPPHRPCHTQRPGCGAAGDRRAPGPARGGPGRPSTRLADAGYSRAHGRLPSGASYQNRAAPGAGAAPLSPAPSVIPPGYNETPTGRTTPGRALEAPPAGDRTPVPGRRRHPP